MRKAESENHAPCTFRDVMDFRVGLCVPQGERDAVFRRVCTGREPRYLGESWSSREERLGKAYCIDRGQGKDFRVSERQPRGETFCPSES